MGEISSERANNLARSDFTPVALQQAGGRRRITAGCANCPSGRAARARSAKPTRRTVKTGFQHAISLACCRLNATSSARREVLTACVISS
jgi:hypothetical protein